MQSGGQLCLTNFFDFFFRMWRGENSLTQLRRGLRGKPGAWWGCDFERTMSQPIEDRGQPKERKETKTGKSIRPCCEHHDITVHSATLFCALLVSFISPCRKNRTRNLRRGIVGEQNRTIDSYTCARCGDKASDKPIRCKPVAIRNFKPAILSDGIR